MESKLIEVPSPKPPNELQIKFDQFEVKQLSEYLELMKVHGIANWSVNRFRQLLKEYKP